MSDGKYMPQLDGIRAFAILSVLVSHFVSGDHLLNRLFHFGRAGVIVFFVLSGYLITGILLRYRDLGGRGGQSRWRPVGVFYGRRVLRIFPIYYLTIGVAAALGYEPVRSYWIWHVTYTSNMASAFQGAAFGDAGHLWSLCVEEQFYLLWPVLVLFAPRRLLSILATFMVIGGIAYKYGGAVLGLGWIATNFTLMGCFDSLGLGALVAIRQHLHDVNTAKRLIRLGATVGLVALIVLQVARAAALSDIRKEPFYQGFIDMAVSLAFLPVLAAAIDGVPGMQAALLTWRPLRYIGKISYGIYLYHLFLQTVLPRVVTRMGMAMPQSEIGNFLLYASAAIAVASLSWYAIEKPVNSLKRYVVPPGAPPGPGTPVS